MQQINELINKEKLTLLGAIVKLTRIKQNLSHISLCEGICIPY